MPIRNVLLVALSNRSVVLLTKLELRTLERLDLGKQADNARMLIDRSDDRNRLVWFNRSSAHRIFLFVRKI
jgi:hypothetical protein